MNIVEEIIKHFVAFFGGVGLIIIVVFLFPEKIEKWSVMLWKVIYFIIKKGEKKIITHDIQGRVNAFSKSLKEEIANYEPIGIKIQWVTEKETASDFLKGNRLIIRMRKHNNQNKNFVYASMVFISKTILTRTKKYLSPSQKESVDLFIGRKLFQKEKPQIEDQFFDDYFSPKATSSNRIKELLEKYDIIDKVGLFFPILIQELNFLGKKVFYKPKNEKIITEVASFINFLQKYAEREVGEDEIQQNFKGAYCRCGIVIIAKQSKRETGDLRPYIEYIKKLIEMKLENIYLIGSALEKNKIFIDQISKRIQSDFKLEKYTFKKYKAKINIKGERKEVDSYLILHRSPNSLRYYGREYQEKFVDSLFQRAEEPRSKL